MSVVLPTKDRPRELRRALRSVAAQTMADLEVIVVDDGSTPPADAGDDRRVRVLRHDVARGVSAARNAGIAQARGEWIAFLDDDDVWHPAKLEVQLAAAARTGAAFLCTSALLVNAAGRTIGRYLAPDAAELPRRLLELNAVGVPSTVLVRRDALARTGGFDPALSTLADWDLWLRLSDHAPPCPVAEVTTAVADHAGSMQVTQAAAVRDELAAMRAKHRARAQAAGVTLGSDRVEAWFAAKDWRAHRTPRTAWAYARATLGEYGAVGTLRLAGSRWVRRATTPAWVREAFRA